ncbi:helix-turn-helix domain-containing protein [Sphingobacterium sp.]|uniref:helix-turn-helix domain-containing protein n=1 Tax=Sphingobacterium sp. TaxID=341027 RepID=UPI0039185531
MERARQILLTEDATITQVMYRVEISSSFYFTSAFKKEFGETPSEYLKGGWG